MSTLRVRLHVRLFGAFRKYGHGRPIEFEVPSDVRVGDVRAYLFRALKEQCPGFDNEQLIRDSAVAGISEILHDSRAIAEMAAPDGRVELAILPPVCGG